jgi:hypothetical protein
MDGKRNNGDTTQSAGLARIGTVLIWTSVGILLLSLTALFSYMISQTGAAVTEDDFKRESDSLWYAEIEVGEMGSISISVDSDDPVEIELTVLDDRGHIEKTYKEKTPLEEELVMMDEGRYTIEILIMNEEWEIDDLEIEVVSTGMDTVNICLGSVCILGLFLGIGGTGLIFTILAISKRNSELKPPEVLPPWLSGSYGFPPPPPRYYHGPTSPSRNDQSPRGAFDRNRRPDDWGSADYWSRRGYGKW